MLAPITQPQTPRLPAIAFVAFFALVFSGHAPAQKSPPQVDIHTSILPVTKEQNQALGVETQTAEGEERVIPPPPRQSGAEFDPIDPKNAHSPESGQNMFWDCVKKTWVDSKTGKAVPGHFEGRLDKDGEIIPPPPRQSGAEFDPIDPKNAHNPETGQNLHWDRKEKTWKDSKTGKAVPGRFKGRLTKKPCPPPATKTTDGVKTAAVPARFELGLGYSYMHTDGELVNHLNGFVVNGFYNVNSWLAVGGEFSGLYGTHTDHYSDGNVDTSLDRYLYLFGPQVSWQPCEQAKVFGHVLVGGAHDYNQVSYPGGSIHSSANAFAMAIGGGVDVKVTPNFSISPSIDYAPTAFSSPAGDWQNNWRVEVVAKFRW